MSWFTDSLTLDAPRKTKDGFLVVRARSARTGVYSYTGREIDPDNRHGLRDKGLVNVLRDDATVFDAAAVQSFIGKPVTDNHPSEPVTAANWRQHARGTIMGALRDGDYLAFDLLLTDAEAIAKVNAGKRELSNGYAAELEYGRFVAADGTVCDARQSRITGGNHVALVDAGRAGPECSIRDHAPNSPNPFHDAQAREAEAYASSVSGMNSWRDGSPEQKAIKAAQQVAESHMSAAEREKAALEKSFEDPNAWRKTQPSASWSNPNSPKY